MAYKPVFSGMLATNILTAFILNAFVGALVATIVVEVRRDMDRKETPILGFFAKIIESVDPNPFKTEFRKMVYTFIAGFFTSIVIYNALYLLIAFGGGMLATNRPPKYF